MNHDINIKKLRLNCFRQSKVPGEFMLQMRVPGGMVDAKYLSTVQHIAQTWGDGNFHFGTRQTFDITGIKYEDIPAVNEYLESYIREIDEELCGVDMNTVAHEPQPWDPKAGYPTIGARNITANAVAPGFIETDMTDALSEKQRAAIGERIAAKRFGTAEEVAALVRFLASEGSGYITGQVICIDGGMSL